MTELVETPIAVYQYALEPTLVFRLVDQDGDAIDPSSNTIRLAIYDGSKVIATLSTGGLGVVTGTDADGYNIATATMTAACTNVAGSFKYELRMLASGVNVPLYRGAFIIKPSPQAWTL